jgi:hypothetical protein
MKIESNTNVELIVRIDGVEAFGLLNDDMGLMCSDADRDLVLAALSEALVTLCGTRPRAEVITDVSVQRRQPAPVLQLVTPPERP